MVKKVKIKLLSQKFGYFDVYAVDWVRQNSYWDSDNQRPQPYTQYGSRQLDYPYLKREEAYYMGETAKGIAKKLYMLELGVKSFYNDDYYLGLYESNVTAEEDEQTNIVTYKVHQNVGENWINPHSIAFIFEYNQPWYKLNKAGTAPEIVNGKLIEIDATVLMTQHDDYFFIVPGKAEDWNKLVDEAKTRKEQALANTSKDEE